MKNIKSSTNMIKKYDRKIWYKIWYSFLRNSKYDKEKYDKKYVGTEYDKTNMIRLS